MSDNTEDTEKEVCDVVRLALAANVKQQLVKRQDITRLISNNSRASSALIHEARKRLRATFGLDLRESKPGEFLVINILPVDRQPPAESFPVRVQDRNAILIPLLTTIWMSGGSIHQRQIRKLFFHLGVSINKFTLADNMTGLEEKTLNKYLDETLVRHHYLTRERVEDTDPPEYTYSLGARGEVELDKKSCLAHVCQVLGAGERPEAWTTQFREAQEQDTRRQQAVCDLSQSRPAMSQPVRSQETVQLD